MSCVIGSQICSRTWGCRLTFYHSYSEAWCICGRWGSPIEERRHLHINIIWKKLHFLKLWWFFHRRCQCRNASFRHFSRWFLSHLHLFHRRMKRDQAGEWRKSPLAPLFLRIILNLMGFLQVFLTVFFPGSSVRWCIVFPSRDPDWFVKNWGL